MGKELGAVACTCYPSYGWKLNIGGLQSQQAWAKSDTLSPKQPEQKGLEDVV
jgi:hypothetical protein